jgi:hypothetical protein
MHGADADADCHSHTDRHTDANADPAADLNAGSAGKVQPVSLSDSDPDIRTAAGGGRARVEVHSL